MSMSHSVKFDATVFGQKKEKEAKATRLAAANGVLCMHARMQSSFSLGGPYVLHVVFNTVLNWRSWTP